jgi:hypothetical protein
MPISGPGHLIIDAVKKFSTKPLSFGMTHKREFGANLKELGSRMFDLDQITPRQVFRNDQETVIELSELIATIVWRITERVGILCKEDMPGIYFLKTCRQVIERVPQIIEAAQSRARTVINRIQKILLLMAIRDDSRVRCDAGRDGRTETGFVAAKAD